MASGLGLVSAFTCAPRRPPSEVGKVFEEDYTDASIKMSLLFAFWEKRDDGAGHSTRVHP